MEAKIEKPDPATVRVRGEQWLEDSDIDSVIWAHLQSSPGIVTDVAREAFTAGADWTWSEVVQPFLVGLHGAWEEREAQLQSRILGLLDSASSHVTEYSEDVESLLRGRVASAVGDLRKRFLDGADMSLLDQERQKRKRATALCDKAREEIDQLEVAIARAITGLREGNTKQAMTILEDATK